MLNIRNKNNHGNPHKIQNKNLLNNERNKFMNNNIHFDDNGNIVAKKPLPNDLPDISVTFQSGKTTYVFVAEFDGEKSLPEKLLNNLKKEVKN